MEDDCWESDPWGRVTYGGISDRWSESAGSMSHKEVTEILKSSYIADENKELNFQWDVATLRAKGLNGIMEDLSEATQGNFEVVGKIKVVKENITVSGENSLVALIKESDGSFVIKSDAGMIEEINIFENTFDNIEDFEFRFDKKGELIYAKFKATKVGDYRFNYNDNEYEISTNKGGIVEIDFL